MNEGENEVYGLSPEKATAGRFAVLVLAFTAEASQAVANLFSGATMIAAQHTLHQAYNREFQGIARNYDNTSGLGAGGPESQD